MSEILLDSLVRSVETLEKKTDKIQGQVNGIPDHSEFHKNVADRLGAAENDIKELPGKIFMPLPEILGLTHELQKHSRLLSIPKKQEIRHEHHLSKPVVVSIVLSLIVIGLLLLEYYTLSQADQHKKNDLKYRYLRAFQSLDGQKILHQIDSKYDANPEQFRKDVLQKEQSDLERFEDFKRMQQMRSESKEIEKKWKERPQPVSRGYP
jgi:hypothetical protein